MKILAVEKSIDGVDNNNLQPLLENEALKVWELQQQGYIREIYFTQSDHNAVIILECTNSNEAAEVLNTLPLVKEKLISFDVIPLVPYDGFQRLFDIKKDDKQNG